MSLMLRFAARSDVGLIRTNNEDAVYAGPRLVAVADGMGGHAAGDVASAVTIATLAPLDDDDPPSDLLGALDQSIRQANDQLRQMMDADSELDGMGTTLTALLWSGTRLALAHIGDSRAYLMRDGELTQITHDHTLVQHMVDEGQLDEADIPTHPQRSVILRVLNGRPDVEADLSVREARAGDRYLLCSDGLSGVVSKDTLRATLALPDPEQVVDALIDLALRGGAPDNVTCVVCDVVEGAGTTSGAPVIGGSVADGDDAAFASPTPPQAAPQHCATIDARPPGAAPKTSRRDAAGVARRSCSSSFSSWPEPCSVAPGCTRSTSSTSAATGRTSSSTRASTAGCSASTSRHLSRTPASRCRHCRRSNGSGSPTPSVPGTGATPTGS